MTAEFTIGQINLVLVYNNLTPAQIPTDNIKSILLRQYGNETKIFLSQFPDLTAIIAPQNQINIIAEGKRVQIVNGGSGEITSREINKFSQLIASSNQSMLDKGFQLTTYGFNYSMRLQFSGTEDNGGKILTSKLIKSPSSINSKIEGQVVSSTPGLAFIVGDIRYDLRFEPVIDETLTISKSISVTNNVHISNSNLPDPTTMERDINAYLENTKKYVKVLLGLR